MNGGKAGTPTAVRCTVRPLYSAVSVGAALPIHNVTGADVAQEFRCEARVTVTLADGSYFIFEGTFSARECAGLAIAVIGDTEHESEIEDFLRGAFGEGSNGSPTN